MVKRSLLKVENPTVGSGEVFSGNMATNRLEDVFLGSFDTDFRDNRFSDRHHIFGSPGG